MIKVEYPYIRDEERRRRRSRSRKIDLMKGENLERHVRGICVFHVIGYTQALFLPRHAPPASMIC
jgi:hypothetical protein